MVFMKERVKILGVSVDNIKLDRLFSKTQYYLSQEACHVIYFVGMKTVLQAKEDESFLDFLDSCDHTIVAERTMEEKIYGEKNSLSKEKKLLAQRYLERLLNRMHKNQLSLYLIGNDEKEMEILSNNLEQYYNRIQSYGSCIHSKMEEEEVDAIINDINAVAPDVIFILLNGQQSKEFLEKNRLRMNVKLCLCIGESEEEVLQEIGLELPIPNWVKYLGFENYYRRLFDNSNFTHTILKKIFQKKMQQEDLETEKEQKSKE